MARGAPVLLAVIAATVWGVWVRKRRRALAAAANSKSVGHLELDDHVEKVQAAPADDHVENVQAAPAEAEESEDEIDAADAPNAADFKAFLAAIRSNDPAAQLSRLLAASSIDVSLSVPGSNDFRFSYLFAALHEMPNEGAVPACVKVLLSHKADPNYVDGTGRTALMYAAYRDQPAAVRALLEGGARVDEHISPKAKHAKMLRWVGRTPLQQAVEAGASECVRILCEHGADPRARPGDGRHDALFLTCLLSQAECLEHILTLTAPERLRIDAPDAEGRSAVLAAADSGAHACVRALLAANASPNHAEPSRGLTPLMVACEAKGGAHTVRFDYAPPAPEHFAECVRLLLDASADVEAHSDRATRALTPLLYAASAGNLAALRVLLCERHVNPNSREHTSLDGLTPLAIALATDAQAAVRALCAAGAFAANPREPRELLSAALLKGSPGLSDARRASLVQDGDWVQQRQLFVSPLHYLEVLDPAHLEALLRDGADVHLPRLRRRGEPRDAELLQTPAAIALELVRGREEVGQGHEKDGPTDSLARSNGARVLRAERPWSPETHTLFPARARQHALDLFLVGVLLARSAQSAEVRESLAAVWRDSIIPLLVSRTHLEPGTAVQIRGLTGAVSLNGERGVVQCATAAELASGRVPVLLVAAAKAKRASSAKAPLRRVGVRASNLAVVRAFQPTAPREVEADRPVTLEEWQRIWRGGILYAQGRLGAPCP
jgi:ankyrin repeat protein